MRKLTNGKSQFNSENAKKFREVMAKWNDAQCNIAQEILFKQDRVKAHKLIIESNEACIKKLKDGGSVIGNRTIEDFEKDNAELRAKIDAENKAMAEYTKAQKPRIEGGMALVTDELYNAYSKFTIDDDEDGLYDAIAKFLEDNGVEPRHKTVYALLRNTCGKNKAGARTKVKTGGEHNCYRSKKAWAELFLGEVVLYMGDALPKYKFTYVLKDARK